MLAHKIDPKSASDLPTSAGHKLHDIFAMELERVEAEIIDNAKSAVTKVSTITEYVVSSGGKRVRPMLTLASAAVCGQITPATYKLATAVEYIHTATLLHDDVLDDSDMRRGRLASRRVWGNTSSVLVGDFLFARAFELMVHTGSLSILDILSKSASIIVEGEIRQLDAIMGQSGGTRADYFATIDAKTAELFRSACLTGAMSGGCANTESLEAMATFGLELGRAFQIIDDILDYVGDDMSLGKRTGDDFRDQKLTLPIILAAETGSPAKADEIFALMRDTTAPEMAFNKAIAALHALDVFALAREIALEHIEIAISSLDKLPEHPLKSQLSTLASQGLDRLN